MLVAAAHARDNKRFRGALPPFFHYIPGSTNQRLEYRVWRDRVRTGRDGTGETTDSRQVVRRCPGLPGELQRFIGVGVCIRMFVGVGLRALLVSELYCAISKKKELQSYWISTICLFKWSLIIFDFSQQIRLWESFHAVNKWDYESLFTLPLIYLKKETRIAYFTGRRDSIYVGTILRRSTKGREEFSIYHFLIKKNSAFIYQSSLYKDGKKGRKKLSLLWRNTLDHVLCP